MYRQSPHDLPNDSEHFYTHKTVCKQCYLAYAADWRAKRERNMVLLIATVSIAALSLGNFDEPRPLAAAIDTLTPPVLRFDTSTLSGLMTGFNSAVGGPTEGTKQLTGTNGNPALYYNSFYEGLQDLDAYWETHGNQTGAVLCTSSLCGLP